MKLKNTLKITEFLEHNYNCCKDKFRLERYYCYFPFDKEIKLDIWQIATKMIIVNKKGSVSVHKYTKYKKLMRKIKNLQIF